MEELKWKKNHQKIQHSYEEITRFLSKKEIQKVLTFHQSFENYKRTPLTSLPELSTYLGVNKVYIKDESYRFGLNAFKVLGGAYAIGCYLARLLNKDITETNISELKSIEVREKLGDITFATATDGNHGRGVAWAARELGYKAVVYMPKGSSEVRLQHIKDTGAEAYMTDMNYDDAVRYVAQKAETEGWIVVQDTAWEGYETIPTWIIQGYAALAAESLEQLQENGIKKPTHLFLQAGVGAFAGSICGYFASLFKEQSPITITVEPDQADCLYRSFLTENNEAQAVTGDMNTIMDGLACGEPNPIAWNVLKNYVDFSFSCPDPISATGMRMLGNPMGKDPRIISGESGSVTAGLVHHLMTDRSLEAVKEELMLDENSILLLINTEGDTDPIRYRQIVWGGAYPSSQGDLKNEKEEIK